MPRPQTLYFITETDGRVRQIVNGVVTSLNKKTPLRYAPIGDDDIQIMWERSMDWWGQVRNFSLPLGFVGDGKSILRNDGYKFNTDRELWLLIKFLTCEIAPAEYKIYYKHLYKGQIDMGSLEDVQGEQRVNVNIMEGGIAKLLSAYGDTEYLIPFDDDSVLVNMDGIQIDNSASYIVTGEISNTIWTNRHPMPMGYINSETLGSESVFGTQELENISNLGDYINESDNYFLINTGLTAQTYRLRRKLRFTCTNNDINAAYRVDLFRRSTGIAATNIYNSLVSLVDGQTYDIDIDFTFTLDPGDIAYIINDFFGAFPGGSVDVTIQFEDGTDIIVEYVSREPSTQVRAMSPINVYKKLAVKIGIDPDKAISGLLTSSTYYLTCGDAIRGIESDTVGIKTTMNLFCKAFDCYYSTGRGIESGDLVYERRTYFFDQSKTATALGSCREFKPSRAVELMHPSIRIGHKEQQIDNVNGRYDFNGYHVYTTPVKGAGGNELNLVSPYKAGPYEIEIKRIIQSGKPTTDDQRDNEVYVLDVAPTADPEVFDLDRSVVPDSGVPYPDSIFNVRLRPSAMLQQHYRWIRSWEYQYDGQINRFEQANRNSDLVVAGLKDGRDVAISSMGDRIFLPWWFEFENPVPVALPDSLDADPNIPFTTTWEGVDFGGFMFNAGIAPVSSAPQVFKLLSFPDNDLTELIWLT